jgi:hypothetical protein
MPRIETLEKTLVATNWPSVSLRCHNLALSNRMQLQLIIGFVAPGALPDHPLWSSGRRRLRLER